MNSLTFNIELIRNRIFTIRDLQIMIDEDLAKFYGVETRVLNQAVKRNINRFPNEFRFMLDEDEVKILKSQSVISSKDHGGRRKPIFVFTEQGVGMLSAVLKSDTAVKVSIQIMQAFVQMKKLIYQNAAVFKRLEYIELNQIEFSRKFEQIFKALDDKKIKPIQGIFFDGQIFDAYVFVSDLIRSASKSIILIDNYIDETILTLFMKRKTKVNVSIYTKYIDKQLALDLKKYNEQYPKVNIYEFKNAHDRFLIIDDKYVYHFGASLKDLGKKIFAFSKFDAEALAILNKLNEFNKIDNA